MSRDAICQNCGTVWASGVKPIWECKDLAQRIEPGEVLPVGECPSCGAFCHYIEPMCRYCQHEMICGLRRTAREMIVIRQRYRHHFLTDNDLVFALADLEKALAGHCAMYKGTYEGEKD